MSLRYALFVQAIALAAGTSACSSSHVSVPSAPFRTSSTEAASKPTPRSQQVATLFGTARGRPLRDADLDSYIDAPLNSPDRALAHKFMAFMPPNQRGDFLAMTADKRLISNSAQLLSTAKMIHSVSQGAISSPATTRQADHTQAMDFVSSCSPPNPPSSAGGAYSRQVSQCGFGAGWAFLNVPCGETSLQSGESGNTYFELTGPSGSEVEGGLFTLDGATFQPYLRSSAYGGSGYETLSGGLQRYSCGEQMMIVHGVTQGVGSFTEIGDASAYNPRSVWVNQAQVTMSNPVWLFGPLPSDIAGQIQGTDAAGYTAPCPHCSISEVTTLAQNTNTYNSNGSYFGVDANSGDDEIEWIQVAFGNWGSDCEPGTTLCTIYVAPDPYIYYGGPQCYPDCSVSQSNFGPTGYGPYETTDGIAMPEGQFAEQRRGAAIGLNEPLPPPPCTFDSSGLCSVATSTNSRTSCAIQIWNLRLQIYVPHPEYYDSKTVYATYKPGALRGLATKTIVKAQNGCAITSTTWSPSEPRVMYNDPNLP